MSITSPLILPADVVIVPVADLSPDVRAHLQCEADDYAITRPRSRTPSRIIDSAAAELLLEFRSPKTIVEAVISYSKAKQSGAEEVLVAAYPMIQKFVSARLLVSVDSGAASEILQSLDVGDRFGGFEVVRCIQVLDDTELYQARKSDGVTVALKIARPAARDRHRQLAREAEVLKHLDAGANPELLEEGVIGDQHYLAVAWFAGVPVSLAAEQLRRRSAMDNRKELLQLSCSILDAYCHLHVQNVIHGDVHPRNVLVDSSGAVRIVDYGLARVVTNGGDHDEPKRGGVGFFFEPEYAQARLARKASPQSSMLGEQYSLGVLLYYLVTGTHYLDFSLERQAMLRQIVVDSPEPFLRRGCAPWPALELILTKALSKDPANRFSSLIEFATELHAVPLPEKKRRAAETDVSAADALLTRVLQRAAVSGPLLSGQALRPPTCSVTYGAAGIAYALYRIACIRNEPALLSLADIWSTKAIRERDNGSAYFNAEFGISTGTVGPVSMYHSAAGLYCVQALISAAMGDAASLQQALDAFLVESQAPCRHLDLTLGRSGALLACSLLLETGQECQPLQRLGDRISADIQSEISAYAPIAEGSELKFLGIAHGWAGVLFALMRWCQASGGSPSLAIEERLRQLAACAELHGRGIQWKRKIDAAAPDYMAGWCNGSAGFVHLWTLSHEMFRDEAYLALADKTAWHAWEEPDTVGSLCCGLAGRAYGLLKLYKHCGDSEWLTRARELANGAAASIERSGIVNSLYKGDVGVAVLAADLLTPEASCMPLFEHEGWPRYTHAPHS